MFTIVYADNPKLKIAQMELEKIRRLAVVSLIRAIKTCSTAALAAFLDLTSLHMVVKSELKLISTFYDLMNPLAYNYFFFLNIIVRLWFDKCFASRLCYKGGLTFYFKIRAISSYIDGSIIDLKHKKSVGNLQVEDYAIQR